MTETTNSMQCDEITLVYAILAHISQDNDPYMVTLLTHYKNPAELLELLYTMYRHEGTVRAQFAQNKLDTAFFECVHLAWKHDIDASRIKQFHNRCHHWVQQLSQLPSHSHSDIADMLTEHGKYWILSRNSALWPSQCAEMWLHNVEMPLVFWGVGNMNIFQACLQPVAIVGSRICNDYGYRTAHSIGQACASDGHTVIAGGAFGIDTAAHWGALSARSGQTSQYDQSGSTISIFAGGLNHMGPSRNNELFQRIVASDGALISELSPRVIPAPHRFLSRNRLIAALCNSLVIVQAKKRSGALNTAKWAREMFRTVYAVPGNIDMPHNAGCNDLLEEGYATIVTQTQHVEYLTHAAHAWYAPPIQEPTVSPNMASPKAVLTASLSSNTETNSNTLQNSNTQPQNQSQNKNQGTTVGNTVQKPQFIDPVHEDETILTRANTEKATDAKHPMLKALKTLTRNREPIAIEQLQAYMTQHHQYTVVMFNTQMGILEAQGELQRVQHMVMLTAQTT